MNKQAAIYARVSTDDQAERGYSLPSQIEACQRFASQKGFDVAAVFQDDVSGAMPISTRPEGAELQRALDLRQVNAVIVYQVDRLSRDIVDLLSTVRAWLRAGVEVHALDIGQITSELDIVLVIKGWQGSDERQKIAERTKRGRDTKAKAGRVVGVGTPPYGYKYSDGELLIDETQAEVVRMVFEWYVSGEANLIGIAQRLTAMGIPTPSQAKGLPFRRSVWGDSSTNWIIRNETYCGVLRYGKEIGSGGRGGRRAEHEHITIEVPAIVSRETWERAQERRVYNSRAATRRMKRNYLLRGIIFCGCGRRMVGSKSQYHCTRHYRVDADGNLCPEPLVYGRVIEPATWNYVMRLLRDPARFEAKLRDAQAREALASQPKERELDHVIALLEDTEREADEIARAMPKAKGIIARKLEQQSNEVNRRYEALTARKAKLDEEMNVDLTDDNIDSLLQFRETVALGLENPAFQDKRQWLELLQVSVTVTNQQAVISCRISSKPFTFSLGQLGEQFGPNISRNPGVGPIRHR